MNARKKAARNSCNYAAPTSTLVKRDMPSVSQLEYERLRAANFEAGSLLAAAALCIMFLILSLGVVVFQW